MMTPEQDKAVLAKWDELGKKQNPNFDITKDVNYAYLFHHFSEEDQDVAWELIPKYKEIRHRIQELMEGQRQPDEIGGGIPMYVLPSNKNTVTDETALKMVKQYIDETLENVSEEEFSEEIMEVIKDGKYEIYDESKHGDLDYDDELDYELSEIRSDMSYEGSSDGTCYYALSEYVVHLTKMPDVTDYILTPTYNDQIKKSNFYKTGFDMYMYNVSFFFSEDGRIIIKNGEEE